MVMDFSEYSSGKWSRNSMLLDGAVFALTKKKVGVIFPDMKVK